MDTAAPAPIQCALCNQTTPIEALRKINNQPVCSNCQQDIESELKQQQQLSAVDLPKSLLLSVLGALTGAAVWCAVVVIAKLEVGYIALLVGFLAGKGATLTTKARGKTIQMIAAGAALVGIVVGKLAVCWYYVYQYEQSEHLAVGLFSLPTALAAVAFLQKSIGPFDLLWAFISLRVAWALGRPTALVKVAAK